MEIKKGYQLSTAVKNNITEIVITGEVTFAHVDDLRDEVRNIAWTLNAKALLIDVTGLKGTSQTWGK